MTHNSPGTLLLPKPELQLIDESQLCQRFGFPQTLAFKTTLSLQPPTLPTLHVSRWRLFSELARSLDEHSTISVVAYPNSGKTITVAEFARSHPSKCLWFTLPPNATAHESWFVLLCWRLAQFLELEDIDPQQVASALAQRVIDVIDVPILLVIDNAQHCQDLCDLSVLQQVAEASNQRFRIVLISTDDPAFRTKSHGAGISVWPCPGLNVEEASELYKRLDGPLADPQKECLSFLVSMTDGHVGLLRLAHRLVKAIKSDEDRNAFIAARRAGLGPDAESKRVHIVEQFRAGLSDVEFTMCKRVSISLGPFPKRVARAAWICDSDESSFPEIWNRCMVAAFDATDDDRYSLPDLYQQGCREFCTEDELRRWHLAIADELEHPVNGGIDPGDVVNSVAHRVLGHNPSDALKKAAMFLIMVRGKHRRLIHEYLAIRFDLWLSLAVASDNADAGACVLWHSIRSRICRELGWSAKANASLTSLERVLTAQNDAVDPLFRSMGWGTLLAQASSSGNVDLAVRASAHLTSEDSSFRESFPRYREFCVLSAYVTARRNPLPFLCSVVLDSTQLQTQPASLWDKQLGYEFWRSVALAMYFSISRAQQLSSDGRALELKAVADIVHKLRQLGESNVAVILGASLVRLQIDVARDFTQALKVAEQLTSVSGLNDPRVEAHLRLTVADAFRCADDLLPAEHNYRQALAIWPATCGLDRNENLSLLAITIARQGRYGESAQMMRQAATHLCNMNAQTMAIRCRLEAALMRCHTNNNVAAVRELIVARSLMTTMDATCPEWVLLGQLAMLIATRAEGGKGCSSLPLPGFTLAIDGPNPDAKDMKPIGPVVMLARACEAVGLPHRAVSLYRIALDEADPTLKVQTAAIALTTAIAVGDIARAAYLVTLASRITELPEMKEVGSQSDGFTFGFLIGPVVFAAINSADGRVEQLEAAVRFLDDSPLPRSEAVDVLRQALLAILCVERDSDLKGLETAYQSASSARAWIVARHLTWFWLFRAMWNGSIPGSDLIRWLWRYCRLTVLIGENDPVFCESSVEQFGELLSRIADVSTVDLFALAKRRLSDRGSSHSAAISSVAVLFAEWSASGLGVASFQIELREAIRTGAKTSIGGAVDIFVSRLLGLILLPLAEEQVNKLRNDVSGLATALDESASLDTEMLRRWQDKIRKLSAMVDTLETGMPTPLVFDALLEWRNEMPPKLQPNSAANFYVWLRHMLTAAGRDPNILPTVWASVGGEHAASLLHHPEVHDFLRRRLGVCHWTARGYLAYHRLLQAAVIVRTQQKSQIPIRSDIWENSHWEVEQAIATVKEAVSRLDGLESEYAKSADTSFDHWSVLTEAARLRQMVGSILWKMLGDSNAVEEWLQSALKDFREAVCIARTGVLEDQDASMLIRPAVQGRSLARFVGDNAAEKEFDDLLARESKSTAWVELLRDEEATSALDPILNSSDPTDCHLAQWDDPAFAEQLVDHFMKSLGLPDDRRPFVIADARKSLIIERVQQKFCRHLQPLQDLLHTHSPSTAYTGPTYYTGACTLLGYQTQIELEDIETVISSFQRLHCDNCLHRSPKASP